MGLHLCLPAHLYVTCPLIACLISCTPPVLQFIMSAPAPAKKKRTFRKYSYRGVDLDQLLELSTDQVCRGRVCLWYKGTSLWCVFKDCRPARVTCA